MSKLVLVTLISIVFVLLVVSIVFDSLTIGKYNNLSCKNDADAVNAKNSVTVSLVLKCIAIAILVFVVLYVYFWRQRRIRMGIAKEFEVK